MPKPVQRPDPMLGALLRLVHTRMQARIAAGLAAAGHEALTGAHFAVVQPLYDQPEGMRATALAAQADISKQSMGVLIANLEQSGHVERVADPDDRRAQRVRLTARGRKAVQHIRSLVSGAEAEWGRALGPARLAALSATLRDILALG